MDSGRVYAEVVVRGVAIRLLWIPPGRFRMGSPETEKGRLENEVEHEVELTQGFWLGQYAVTQGEWEAVMGNNPSEHKGERLPVENVSWKEAIGFCARLTEMARGAGAGR